MSGKWFFIGTIIVLLMVFGALIYPTLHSMVDDVSTTGFLPLLAAAVVGLPYMFLGFVVYAIFRVVKG